MAEKSSRFRKMREDARAFLDERALARHDELPRLHKFAHFWLMVWRSFSRNRCPVRASALAYATLLALIPMLAVVVSITSSLLKKEGEERIDQFIVKLVASVTPAEQRVQSQETGERKQETEDRNQEPASGIVNPVSSIENPSTHQSTNPPIQAATAPPLQHSSTPSSPATLSAEEEQAVKARKAMAKYIHDFIQNTRSGTLGVTGSVLLIFAAISMLGRIEDTFNDIWGVGRGGNGFGRGVLSGALGLASGPHLDGTRRLLTRMPVVGNLIFEFLPLVVLCIAFALFYMLIPNTKVHWRAALAGGLVGGGLWHANNLASVLYVSRVVSNSKIYGSLGLVPVFMIGVYFSWLILLFGAQVAYAYQNRASYLEEKQMEVINQRGREFIALRVMTSVGRRFLRGEPPPSVTDLGQELAAPTRLIQQLLETLCAARLIVETTGADPAYAPARPLETITCHDILLALRAGQGQELETRDEPGRNEVYGEFRRIEEAERQAAAGVTMLALASRAEQKRIDG